MSLNDQLWAWKLHIEQLFFCFRQESSTWSQPSSTWWQPSLQWEWWVLLSQRTIGGHLPEGSACCAGYMYAGNSPVRHHTAELPERGRTVQGQEIWGGKGSSSALKGRCVCVVDHVCLWPSLGFRRPPGLPKQQALPLAAFTQASRNHNKVLWFRGFFYRTLRLMG